MTIRVCGKPRCPGCCIALAGIAITFNEGWAWCPVCTSQKLYAQSHLRYVLHHNVMERCSILSHGLRFYLPVQIDGQMANAIDCFEKLVNEPIPQPEAIAAWTGFTLGQLPQDTRDRSEEPAPVFQKDVRIPFGWQIAGITDTGQVVLTEIDLEREITAETSESLL